MNAYCNCYVDTLRGWERLWEKVWKVWNNLKCLKRCAFQCIKSLKMGFCEEQKSLKSCRLKSELSHACNLHWMHENDVCKTIITKSLSWVQRIHQAFIPTQLIRDEANTVAALLLHVHVEGHSGCGCLKVRLHHSCIQQQDKVFWGSASKGQWPIAVPLHQKCYMYKLFTLF